MMLKYLFLIFNTIIFISNLSSQTVWSWSSKGMKDPVEYTTIYDKHIRYIDFHKFKLKQTVPKMDKKWKEILKDFYIDHHYKEAFFKIDELLYLDFEIDKKYDNYILAKHYILCLKHIKQLKYKINSLESIRKRNVNNFVANYMLGFGYFHINNLYNAKLYTEYSLNINTKFSEGYNLLGNIYSRMKKFDKSIQNYVLAFNLKPDNEIPIFNIATDYFYQKRYEEAYLYYKYAKEVNPENKLVNSNIYFLENKLKLDKKKMEKIKPLVKKKISMPEFITKHVAQLDTVYKQREVGLDKFKNIDKEATLESLNKEVEKDIDEYANKNLKDLVLYEKNIKTLEKKDFFDKNRKVNKHFDEEKIKAQKKLFTYGALFLFVSYLENKNLQKIDKESKKGKSTSNEKNLSFLYNFVRFFSLSAMIKIVW